MIVFNWLFFWGTLFTIFGLIAVSDMIADSIHGVGVDAWKVFFLGALPLAVGLTILLPFIGSLMYGCK
jgi:hypothetical protein